MSFVIDYGNYLLVPIHVLVSLILIGVVLLQTGKGTDWAGVFGGSGSQTAFGPRGVENTLSRVTKIAAIVFMLTSLSISIIQSKRRAGGFDELDVPSAPAAASPSPLAPAVTPAGVAPAGTEGAGAGQAPELAPPVETLPVEPVAPPAGEANPAPAAATP